MIVRFACLAGLAILLSGTNAPSAHGIAGPSPTPKEKASNEQAKSAQAPKPLHVAIVESPEEAVARKRREAESRDHDARDLETQIRAADAAEKQIFPAWVGAILSALGTGLLVWTLLETRKSTAAAVSAARSARDALNSERAWLMQSGIRWGEASDFWINGELHKSGFVYSLSFENAGRSPATHVCVATDARIVPAEEQTVPTFVYPEYAPEEWNTFIGSGANVWTQSLGLNSEKYAAFLERKIRIFVYVGVRYKDIFVQDAVRATDFVAELIFDGRTKTSDGEEHLQIHLQPTGLQNRVT